MIYTPSRWLEGRIAEKMRFRLVYPKTKFFPFKEKEGIEVEVIDLRTLVPLDTATLCRSVKKTGRCGLVIQAALTASFAEHVAFEVQRHVFQALRSPVEIISAYAVPPPMAAPLENENIPSPERIFRSVVRC
jgi:pyruvate dehydrogenase E1 component beta subunit